MSNHSQTRAWIEVNVDALRANLRTIQHRAGPTCRVIPMVKTDAYGVGAERVVAILESERPWGWGVATVEEGVALRSVGVEAPIIVFTPLLAESAERAGRHHLTACISDVEVLDTWAAAAGRHGPLSFHTEVDTGMGRAGFDWRETGAWGAAVHARMGGDLRWEGAFTHFHSADAADPAPTATQWERFQDAVASLPVSREDLMVHAANSAAAVRWPEYAADAVRPGIFLYGGDPAPGLAGSRPEAVVSVRAKLVRVQRVPPGSTVGYGATHVARGWERWATLAIGYGDGIRRSLANRGNAIVRGRRVPIVGRISMDMTVVDITAVPDARVGDVATVLGVDGACSIGLNEIADAAGTISYEILTGLSRRLPRVVV